MKRSLPGLRYVSRRSGIIVLLAVAAFVAAVLQAGVFARLFKETLELRVILPETGLSGLSVGGQVQILGTPAGSVERIVISPNANFYAEVGLDPAMEPFVRRDSRVIIRKQFGIAGAAYLEITRGRGEPLDWDFAVLSAVSDRDATANVGDLVTDLRERIVPLIEDGRHAIRSVTALVDELGDPNEGVPATLDRVTELVDRIARGEGTIGRLIADDTLLRGLEDTVGNLNRNMDSIDSIVANLETASNDVALMTRGLSGQKDILPEIIENTNRALQSINSVMDELSSAVPEVTLLARNSAESSVALPTLLAQTQQTLMELEKALVSLQASWLFGGNATAQDNQRLSPLEVRP